MKKLLGILACIAVIAGLVIGGFSLWKSFNENNVVVVPSGDVIDVNKGLAEKAIVKTVEIKEIASSANRIIDVKYPSIQSFVNKDFQNYVNNSITSVILAYRDEIMVMIDDETPDTTLYTYKTIYEKLCHGDYLSLVISNDYQTNGIRSNKWKDIYNIDVKQERIFYLNDVFSANVDYEKAILSEITKQAKDKNIELMNGNGLNQLSDKQKFFIKDGKLVIYFDPSEIAPTSYGELTFEMPFILDENGKFTL